MVCVGFHLYSSPLQEYRVRSCGDCQVMQAAS